MIGKTNLRALTCALTLLAVTPHLNALENAVTFEEAYNDVFCQSFDIKAAEENVEGRRAETWQAGRRPNPILTFEGENLGHTYHADENELFLAITTPIELGGKRRARERFADAVECESYWDLEVVKTELTNEFLHSFVNVAAAQERIALANRQASLSKEVISHVKFKIDAGKGNALEMKKAEIAHNTASIFTSQQQATLRQKMLKLKSFWNCLPSFSAVQFPLYDIQEPPSLCSLTSGIDSNPVIGKAQANTTKACRLLELERSQRIPTIALQVGVSTERFVNDPTVTVGIDVPLHIFDNNSGNIQSASHDHARAIYEQQSAMQRLLADLEVTYNEWLTAYQQAMLLKNEILPRAEETHEFSKQGYLEGKFNYLDYLDAQRTLADAQQQYLDAVEEYHHKRADVLKLAMTCTTTN